MTDNLGSDRTNIESLVGYPKWPTTNISWSVYTNLPNSYVGKHVIYGVGTNDDHPLYSDVFNNSGLTELGLKAARSAFAGLEAISTLTFTEASQSTSSTANIHFGSFKSTYAPSLNNRFIGAYASPGYQNSQIGTSYVGAGDVWVTAASGGATESGAPTRPDIALQTMRHELGHVLGLSHPRENSKYDPGHDNQHYTIMSTNLFLSTGNSVSEYQLYDIAALQSLYGRNLQSNSEDSVYDITKFTGSVSPTDAENNRYFALWDAGGKDTIDVSASSNENDRVFIDLRPGHFSSIGVNTGLTTSGCTVINAGIQNLAISFGAIIEDIIGSKFDDILVGNELSNTIAGGAGDDVIYASGSAVRLASSFEFNIGQILKDDGDYGYYNTSGYNAKVLNDDEFDNIFGGDGNDLIFGSNAGDRIDGGDGYDEIYSGSGDDFIDSGIDVRAYGIIDNDRIYSGSGDDTIIVRSICLVEAGTGDDVVVVLRGGARGNLGDGNDIVNLEYVDAYCSLDGGNGNDIFRLNSVDVEGLYGGAGDDIFYASGRSSAFIYGGDGNDTYDFSGHTADGDFSIQLNFDVGWGEDMLIGSNDLARKQYADEQAVAADRFGVESLDFFKSAAFTSSGHVERVDVNVTWDVKMDGVDEYGYDHGWGDVTITDGNGNRLVVKNVEGSWSAASDGSISGINKLYMPEVNNQRWENVLVKAVNNPSPPRGEEPEEIFSLFYRDREDSVDYYRHINIDYNGQGYVADKIAVATFMNEYLL